METPSKVSARLSAVTESEAASPRRLTRRASFSQEELKPATPKGRRLSAVSSLQKTVATESPKRGRPKIINDEATTPAKSTTNPAKRGRPRLVKEDSATSVTKSPSPKPLQETIVPDSPKSTRSKIEDNNQPSRSVTRSPSPKPLQESNAPLTSVPDSPKSSRSKNTKEDNDKPVSSVSRSLSLKLSEEAPTLMGSPKSSPSKNASRSVTKSPSPRPSTPKNQSPNFLTVVTRSSSRSPRPTTPITMVLRSSSKSPNIQKASNEEDKKSSDNSIDDKKSKSIQFMADEENDEREKTKFYKTPHISKNKSSMADNSAETSFELLETKNKTSESLKSDDLSDDLALKTPYRNKLISMSSSTPIGVPSTISTYKLELSLKDVSEEENKFDKNVPTILEEETGELTDSGAGTAPVETIQTGEIEGKASNLPETVEIVDKEKTNSLTEATEITEKEGNGDVLPYPDNHDEMQIDASNKLEGVEAREEATLPKPTEKEELQIDSTVEGSKELDSVHNGNVPKGKENVDENVAEKTMPLKQPEKDQIDSYQMEVDQNYQPSLQATKSMDGCTKQEFSKEQEQLAAGDKIQTSQKELKSATPKKVVAVGADIATKNTIEASEKEEETSEKAGTTDEIVKEKTSPMEGKM